jgi:hypothetical protein
VLTFQALQGSDFSPQEMRVLPGSVLIVHEWIILETTYCRHEYKSLDIMDIAWLPLPGGKGDTE